MPTPTPKAPLSDAFVILAILLLPIVIVNGLLYSLGVAITAFDASILAPSGRPITLATVVIASIVGSLICFALYLVIRALSIRPGQWVQRIGLPLLLLSFLLPLTVRNATVLTFLTLGAMHVIVALPFIRAFARLSRDTLLKS